MTIHVPFVSRTSMDNHKLLIEQGMFLFVGGLNEIIILYTPKMC